MELNRYKQVVNYLKTEINQIGDDLIRCGAEKDYPLYVEGGTLTFGCDLKVEVKEETRPNGEKEIFIYLFEYDCTSGTYREIMRSLCEDDIIYHLRSWNELAYDEYANYVKRRKYKEIMMAWIKEYGTDDGIAFVDTITTAKTGTI